METKVKYSELTENDIKAFREYNKKRLLSFLGGRPFPKKSFVVNKYNGKVRFVTRHLKSIYAFEDDGSLSGWSPCEICNYDEYRLI